MKILINGLAARKGGGQTYLQNILPRLAQYNGVELSVVLYRQFLTTYDLSAVCPVIIPLKPGHILARSLWEKVKLPRLIDKEGYDIYFAPNGLLGGAIPISCKSVVAFRNMLPFSFQALRRYGNLVHYLRFTLLRFAQSNSFQKADLVVFISEHAKRVIDHCVPLRKGKSTIIYHGVNTCFKKPCSKGKIEGLESGRYVLYVSHLSPYKGQMEVVASWKYFMDNGGDTDLKLVLAGSSDSSYGKRVKQSVQSLGIGSSVLFLGNVPHESLPALYQNARINIFASTCENCPNILIEALNSGRPVFCSNFDPMPEIGADAPLYFNPYKTEELTGLLSRYIDDDAYLSMLGDRARDRGAYFSWDRTAAHLYREFTQLQPN